MSNVAEIVSLVITIIGVLVALTNIILEVVKKATWDILPTNILALAIAVTLTLVAFFAWAAYKHITVLWYYVAAAVVMGFLVAYAAMFGFDKLKQAFSQVKKNIE